MMITKTDVEAAVVQVTGVPMQAIIEQKKGSRGRPFSDARHLLFYFVHMYCNYNPGQIPLLYNRNRTALHAALRKVEKLKDIPADRKGLQDLFVAVQNTIVTPLHPVLDAALIIERKKLAV
jgi:hypothetical protein